MQTVAHVRAYLSSHPGAINDYPFGPDPLVCKVGGKMFALLSLGAHPPTISLKCDPADAQFLRDTYPAITAGYHLNKRHWNTVLIDGSVPDTVMQTMIDDSYRLVVKGLTKAQQAELG